jgi:hypothetical protein
MECSTEGYIGITILRSEPLHNILVQIYRFMKRILTTALPMSRVRLAGLLLSKYHEQTFTVRQGSGDEFMCMPTSIPHEIRLQKCKGPKGQSNVAKCKGSRGSRV